jgi:hypothetical protein
MPGFGLKSRYCEVESSASLLLSEHPSQWAFQGWRIFFMNLLETAQDGSTGHD